MAPSVQLVARDWRCGWGYNNNCSDWYYWGRWVLAGIVLFVVVAVLVSCSVVARRRRRRGAVPYYGTGWMAGGKYNQQNNTYPMNNTQQGYNNGYPNGDYQQGGYYNPPPAYGQQQTPYTGTNYNPNDGYYGNQESGVQQPPHIYNREESYAPPTGPPPTK